MSFVAAALILGAALCHAAWNFIVKASNDRLGALFMMLSGVALVGLVLLPFVPVPRGWQIWTLIGLSAVLHYGYNMSLLLAYKFADLSVAYPIARGAVPLLVLGLAYATLGQLPSSWGVVGIACVALGIMLLAAFARAVDPRGVLLALLTSVWIAGYTVVDGVGMRQGDQALSFLVWNFASHAPIALAVFFGIWRRRAPPGIWRAAPAAILAPVAYALVLWAQRTTDFAAVSALRETSVIFASLLGIAFLGERQARLRLSAATLVCAGAALIVFN